MRDTLRTLLATLQQPILRLRCLQVILKPKLPFLCEKGVYENHSHIVLLLRLVMWLDPNSDP